MARSLPRLHFRSFRSRILTFVFGLLILVQGAVLLAVNAANVSEARRHIDEALELTASAFRRNLDTRQQILLEKARLLSSDFAFKEAVATGEHATLLSALENHQARVGANVMMLLGMESDVVANTLRPSVYGVPSPLTPLVERAMESEFGEASAIEFLDGKPYQLVVVPLFSPEPTAWIVVGFAIEDAFADELQQETHTHVSLLRRRDGGWTTFCSTLGVSHREALETEIVNERGDAHRILSLDLAGSVFVSLVVPVAGRDSGVVAVLQRSLDQALEPFLRLRSLLLLVFALGLVLSLGGGVLLATRVTRPVDLLAQGASRIAKGDYAQPVEVTQEDEMGVLARSFNNMMKGLAERDRVRDLLGKVVSPEIAEELLSKGIELGGEERTVSVLFTDIRGFTSISEQIPPQSLVHLLNTYLTRVSDIVERNGGVVDKYVGDAVMALFGAPLRHGDDALRSVRTALDLCDAMESINEELATKHGVPLAMGVGVHTGRVVAGNMGSQSRLNYTVVGDGVNLASRLEGLTKRYGVGAIVSDATRAACPGVMFRELDRVRVKGRAAPVAIFEPLGLEADCDSDLRERLALHCEGLAAFRARDWERAERLFRELAAREKHSPLSALYLARIERLRLDPPDSDWDGTTTYDEK